MGDSIINQFLLEQRLKEHFFGSDNKVVYLRADESLPYGYVVEIVDIVKKSGVEFLGLVFEPKKPGQKR
jgi:biopolymer transport protein ExbD